MIFSFLHKLVEILIEYFQSLEDESIRDNFVLIYELLDEIMDHGYPQTTETKILKEFIKTDAYKMKVNSSITVPTGSVTWRMEGIKYKVNQAFLDVVEKVNSIVYKLLIIKLYMFRYRQKVLCLDLKFVVRLICDVT